MSTLYLRDRWFEDLPVGEFHVFGSHTFSELEIVEFAEAFDPRPQSTDPVLARGNHRQGLVASPWLITAMWMRKMVDTWRFTPKASTTVAGTVRALPLMTCNGWSRSDQDIR